MAWYNTGTIALTNGSATVTGSGTNFLVGAQIGEALYAPDGKLYEIQTINSATVITLASNYLGSTASGQGYQIIPTQSLVADLASDVTDLISDFADVRDYAGNGKFNDGAVGTPGITFTQDQDNGLYRIGSNNWALAAGAQKIVDISTSGIDVTGTLSSGGIITTGNTGAGAASAGDGRLFPNNSYGAFVYGNGTTYDVALGQRSTGVALGVLAGTTNVVIPANVGIGTSSISSKFSVFGSQAAIDFQRGTGDSKWELSSDSSTMYIAEMSTGARNYIMTVLEAGSVGINNSNPSAFDSLGGKHLVVGNGVNTSSLTLFSDNTADGNGYGHVAFADSAVSVSAAQYAGLIQYYHGEDSMRFYTNSTEKMRIDTSGRVTMPYQPAFYATPSSAQTNLLANNSLVTVAMGTEIFDVGSNFASNTFTAPVTGKYQLNLSLYLLDVDTAATYVLVGIITSNRNYINIVAPKYASDPAYLTQNISTLADMDAGDTAYIFYQQSGGAAQTDVDADTRASFFQGYLVA
jgi:hypothetical protein